MLYFTLEGAIYTVKAGTLTSSILYILLLQWAQTFKKGRAGGSSDRALKQERLGLKETTTWSRQHERYRQE